MKKIMYILLIISVIITLYISVANIVICIYEYIPLHIINDNIFVQIFLALTMEIYIKLFLKINNILWFVNLFNLACVIINKFLKNISILWFGFFIISCLFNIIVYSCQRLYA